MGRHLHKPLKDIEIGKVLNNLLELASRHRLMIAPDIFLMMKTLTMVEGVALALDPDFDMIAQAEPFIKRVKFERFYPGRIADDMIQLGSQMLQFAQLFPKDVLEITRLIRLQKLTLKMEHQGLDTMLATHDRVSNRISFSIIIASTDHWFSTYRYFRNPAPFLRDIPDWNCFVFQPLQLWDSGFLSRYLKKEDYSTILIALLSSRCLRVSGCGVQTYASPQTLVRP